MPVRMNILMIGSRLWNICQGGYKGFLLYTGTGFGCG